MSQAFAWLVLSTSIAAEVAGTLALRYAEGFTRPLPTLAVGIFYTLAIWLMSISVQRLDIGLAYAVWAGAGTALTALIGMTWFGEVIYAAKIVGIALIVAGVVCLNLSVLA